MEVPALALLELAPTLETLATKMTVQSPCTGQTSSHPQHSPHLFVMKHPPACDLLHQGLELGRQLAIQATQT
eukprot:11806472-Heterocapsa_arctica.AAC.1